MTTKVEIELTDAQIRILRDPRVIRSELAEVLAELAPAMLSQLPKSQKKWRFYKGKFLVEFSDRQEVLSNGGAYIHPDNRGPDAYCFTRGQVFALVMGAFRDIDSTQLSYPVALDCWCHRYLSQQEEE